MSARRAVPQVGYLAQVLGQVVLVVGLSSQLQVAAEWVQPHWIRTEEANILHLHSRSTKKHTMFFNLNFRNQCNS